MDVSNCLFARNVGTGRVAHAHSSNELPSFANCTFIDNDMQYVLEALTRARAASDLPQALAEVATAEAALVRAVEQLDALTTRLGEWDNFQSVLTLTRDILNRKKNLTERTRKFAEENR